MEQTLMEQNADASVGHREYARLDQTGVDAHDIGCHEEHGPPERGDGQRDGPPSPEYRTEQNHHRHHLDTLSLPIYVVPLLQLDVSTDLILQWRIEAPQTRVWECITDAGMLSQWLGQVVDGAVGAEEEFVVDHGADYRCRSTVLAYAEPSRLAFTWHFPDESESVVALDLEPSGTASELRLTHSELGDLVTSYRDGWCVHLSYLEAAALATPLPASMFWQLHGTIAQLNALNQ